MGAGKKIEGYWDCLQCGTKKIKGRFRYCKSCGKPRGEDTRFYMLETNVYAENQDSISNEPDWYCSYCKSLNSAKKEECESCGSSQKDSDKNYFTLLEEKNNRIQELPKYEIPEAELLDTELQQINQSNYTKETPVQMQKDTTLKTPIIEKFKPDSYKWKVVAQILSIALPIFILLGMLIYFIIPKETILNVVDKSWNRSIQIQEYKTVRENNWHVPTGGREAYSQREIHHYDRILDHYETVTEYRSERYVSGYESYVSGHQDLGNGYFQEIKSTRPVYSTRQVPEVRNKPVYISVPVYQTKYYYDIERWLSKNYEKSSGKEDTPYWPATNLAKDNEREGTRSEHYYIVTINNKNKKYTYEISLLEWKKIKLGDILKVNISKGKISEYISY